MNRRGFFALLAAVFGARKLPVRKLYEFPVTERLGCMAPGDVFTIAGVYAINPPTSGIMRQWRVAAFEWPRLGS
jgi:hypothetical protein